MCFVFGLLPLDLGMRVMLPRERQHAMESLSWQSVRLAVPCPGPAQLRSISLQQGLVHSFLLIPDFSDQKVWSPLEAWDHTLSFYYTREKGYFNTFRHLTWSQGSSKLLHIKSEISCTTPHPPKHLYTQFPPRPTALRKRGAKKHQCRRQIPNYLVQPELQHPWVLVPTCKEEVKTHSLFSSGVKGFNT